MYTGFEIHLPVPHNLDRERMCFEFHRTMFVNKKVILLLFSLLNG
jgi:hypothetical protein